MNLDLGSRHPHLLHQQSQQPLALVEVQRIDAFADTFGERLDLASQPVVDRQLPTLRHQRVSLLLE